MAATNAKQPGRKKPTSMTTNLIAGGGAGMMEALVCHPLDTIKVRMQLSKRKKAAGVNKSFPDHRKDVLTKNGVRERGFYQTGKAIAQKETPLALYKGLGPVLTGIVPKMAIRFTSYDWYRQLLANERGNVSGRATFLAGLLAGVTEAVAVVTPMEVVKIRLQAQYHSLADPLEARKYRNAWHACLLLIREEGPLALYRGVTLTALRQGTNQAVNFTVYSYLKSLLQRRQPQYHSSELPVYQTAVIGLISGAMGPLSNAPIDTIKTRLQKGEGGGYGVNAFQRIKMITKDMFKTEGTRAFYKGITPRIMRVAPGQAVTFSVYEYLKGLIEGR